MKHLTILAALALVTSCNDSTTATQNIDTSVDSSASQARRPAHAPRKASAQDTPMDAAIEPEALPEAVILENSTVIADNTTANTEEFQAQDGAQLVIEAPETTVANQENTVVAVPEFRAQFSVMADGGLVGAGADVQGNVQQYAVRTTADQSEFSATLSGVTFDSTSYGTAASTTLTLSALHGAVDAGMAVHSLAQLTDSLGNPVAFFPVAATAGDDATSCTTNLNGICVLSFAGFEGTTEITAEAAGETATMVAEVTEAIYPLGNAIGVQLPTTAQATGDTFEVPVHLSTNGSTPGAYDMRLHFDPSAIAPIAVNMGSCVGMGSPVSNIGFQDVPGTLRFNAIASNPNAACLDNSESAHVATVVFEVIDTASASVEVDCEVKDYLGYNFNPLGSVCTGAGVVQLSDAVPTHLFVSATDAVLDDRGLLGDAVETTAITTTVVMSDGSMMPAEAALVVADTSIISLNGNMASPGANAGTTTITASAFGLTANTSVTTRRITNITMEVADDTLETIEGTETVQPTRLNVFAHWATGSEIFYADVTAIAQDLVTLPAGFELYEGTLMATSAAAGTYTLRIAGIDGATQASADVTVSENTVALEGIRVQTVCGVEGAYDAAQQSYTLTVETAPTAGHLCALQTHAWFADGSVSVVPTVMGVDYTVSENVALSGATIVPQDNQGVEITAEWLNGSDHQAL